MKAVDIDLRLFDIIIQLVFLYLYMDLESIMLLPILKF